MESKMFVEELLKNTDKLLYSEVLVFIGTKVVWGIKSLTSLTEEKNRVDSGWLKKITVRVQWQNDLWPA